MIKPSIGAIQPIRYEGLRRVGDPHELAVRYAAEGADEILYLDVTASLYGSPAIHALVERTSRDVHVPLTVGGGIRTLGDVRRLLRAGADKVAINTAALARPEFITEIAETFGSQCVVVSVEANRPTGSDVHEPYTNSGRDRTRRDLHEWCHEAVERGAGELLITCVNRDGTLDGMDRGLVYDLYVAVPVILSGGLGEPAHAVDAIEHGADAIAIGAALHAGRTTIPDVKAALLAAGHEVRV